jgi:DNA modification methylase
VATRLSEIHNPAPFSANILRFISNSALLPHAGVILDPFAGIGKVHQLASHSLRVVGVEIEPEWAAAHQNTICGNALALPFEDESFDGVVTSPVYGNRMSDSHNAKDDSLRRSYTHDLRRTTGDSERKLHPDNAGTLYAWNKEYWRFHVRAWAEVRRVLKPGAPFLLNVSDFYRTTSRHGRKRLPVVHTHTRVCRELGFTLAQAYPIETPRMRYGQNHESRAPFEYVLHFKR